jgi:DNA-binding response OmpR family regulator
VSELQGKRILAIDDDPDLLWLINLAFSRAGAQVYTAADGQEGLRQFYAHRPHLVILDVMMPLLNGWHVCGRIRQVCDVPIIMLTVLKEDSDVVRGLDLGADDYVPKPFSMNVLLARARAALRRAMPPSTGAYSNGYLTIDLDERRTLVRGQLVRLTATEHQLLAYLFQNADRVLSYQQILENVWGWEHHGDVNYVHVYISRLRKKLEKDPNNPQYLLNERGVGYCFQRL